MILFAPFAYYVYNFGFYNRLYEKNGVYEVLDRNDVKKLTERMFDFFRYNKSFEEFKLKGNIKYFNSNEISHLDDVRRLFNKILTIFYSSVAFFAILIVLLIEKKYLYFIKSVSIILIISSSVLLFFLSILYFFGNNFSTSFEKFHLIFFPQGNWAFPEGSLIITILPFGFFYDFFFKLLTSSFIISVILLVIGVAGLILAKKYIRTFYEK